MPRRGGGAGGDRRAATRRHRRLRVRRARRCRRGCCRWSPRFPWVLDHQTRALSLGGAAARRGSDVARRARSWSPLIWGRAGRLGGTERMLMELVYHSPDRAAGIARGAAVWERLGRPREACAQWIRAARWRDDPEDPVWRKAIACARRDPGAGDAKAIRDYVISRARPERRDAIAAELDGRPAAGGRRRAAAADGGATARRRPAVAWPHTVASLERGLARQHFLRHAEQCQIKMARRRPRQLDLPVPPTWGGRRPGAGRKPTAGRAGVWHIRRPHADHGYPVLVTLRGDRQLPSLRAEATFPRLRRALALSNRANFRVVHFSVQTDHIHLVVEADGRKALTKGIQGLAGRCARAINRASKRHGRVWSDRYHRRPLRTPREMRAAIVYVLQNFRKLSFARPP